ncbi:response regulator transcription factor [Thalassotalea euphylliae]|uniref:DNA-binding response regulator n=1 Tax=Thalassotalea euphylliae TaxID=1655234 RepID=A0A3E0UE88_9GAMM|nr:response regulator transcription factor [Thalassotalea euphylliae]REL35014.1 DNA-binding response regulator [Thalassotalea euphylliae]
MRVLLVEDDIDTADFIVRGLSQSGEFTHHETTGKGGIISATTGDFDVIIFDRLLPDMDGVDAIRVLRQSKLLTPIIVLTALAETNERVAGLEAGADDYLVKPFAFSELHARLKALARRQPLQPVNQQLQLGDLIVDRTTRKVTRAGQTITLLPREYQILEYLLLNTDQLITKTMLLENVWGFSFDPKTSIVQTHVSRLRTKLDKPFAYDLIKTVRGSGYLINDDH